MAYSTSLHACLAAIRPRIFRMVSPLILALPLLCFLLPLKVLAAEVALAGPGGFVFENVVAKAKQTAARPFKDPRGEMPPFLMNIDYDAWRDIRFDTRRSLWQGENVLFTVQFFHPGLYYDRTVGINLIDQSGIRKFPFSPDLFNYGRNVFPRSALKKLGFAGFRLHYPMNKMEYFDEIIVFVGASYFRALAKDQVYGLSARGLAIDTVLPSGEEFPYFREFWFVKPAPGANEITLYALLDSVNVAGAYEFVVKPERTTIYEKSLGSGHPSDLVQPARETRVDVRLTLFFRHPVQKVGIAPLTSMFYYGENESIRPLDDFRPEIHDSDGLLVAFENAEWLWRPLVNPKGFQINSYSMKNPMGFGLLQRDNSFDHYQDLETHYERRPSVWITPVGNWGDGRIELVQIPVSHEISDNVVSYWVPAQTVVPGEPMTFAYSMRWTHADLIGHKGGRVVATRTAEGKTANLRKFVVDFEGGELDALSADEPVMGIVNVAEPGTLVETQISKNRITGGWRLVFLVNTDKIASGQAKTPVELRAFLKRGEDVLTETWNYTYLH